MRSGFHSLCVTLKKSGWGRISSRLRVSQRINHFSLTVYPNFGHLSTIKFVHVYEFVRSGDQVFKTNERLYSAPLSGWQFANEDKAIARHIKKQFKKKQNKKRGRISSFPFFKSGAYVYFLTKLYKVVYMC